MSKKRKGNGPRQLSFDWYARELAIELAREMRLEDARYQAQIERQRRIDARNRQEEARLNRVRSEAAIGLRRFAIGALMILGVIAYTVVPAIIS